MTALSQPTEPQANALPHQRALERLLGRALDWIAASHETMRQRQALRFLSEERLRDIGQTRADVEREISRPFWQR